MAVRRLIQFALLLAAAFQAKSYGGIPEPDALFYGQVVIDGVLAPATNTGVQIVARVDVDRPPFGNFPGAEDTVGQEIGRYRMGDNSAIGDWYLLKIRVESLADGSEQSNNAALVGQTVRIYTKDGDDAEQLQGEVPIVERGFILGFDVGAECAIWSSSPPSGAIDAQLPHSIDNVTDKSGWQSIELTLNCLEVTSIADNQFLIEEIGGDGVAPSIKPGGVSAIDLTTIRVDLDRPIDPGAWTVLTYIGTGKKICLGFLPGDSDQNRSSSSDDLKALVDSINGVAAEELPQYATDLDRGGYSNGGDIRVLVDVLNGAGSLTSWNGQSLPPSPCDQ